MNLFKNIKIVIAAFAVFALIYLFLYLSVVDFYAAVILGFVLIALFVVMVLKLNDYGT